MKCDNKKYCGSWRAKYYTNNCIHGKTPKYCDNYKIFKLKEEIKKLKEEIKKLKEEN